MTLIRNSRTENESRQVTYEELPKPISESLSLGSIFFRSLFASFVSAIVVQIVLFFPGQPYAPWQIVATVSGGSLFCAGLYHSVKHSSARPTAAYITSIIAGALISCI